MKEEIKQRLLNELYLYKPNNGTCLRDVNGYCILGVIFDFWAQEKGVEWEFNKDEQLFKICYIAYHLPNEVLNWADISYREENQLVGLFDQGKNWDKIKEYLSGI